MKVSGTPIEPRFVNSLRFGFFGSLGLFLLARLTEREEAQALAEISGDALRVEASEVPPDEAGAPSSFARAATDAWRVPRLPSACFRSCRTSKAGLGTLGLARDSEWRREI